MADRRRRLAGRFQRVRGATAKLCEPLSPEDAMLQVCDECSPPKWHLAHTSWFFETFVLSSFAPGWRPIDPSYAVLFNSYYESVGAQHPRGERGLISRPSLGEVYDYRRRVDDAICELVDGLDDDALAEVTPRIEIGLQHEQQHQELLLMDVLRNFSCNPLLPAYRDDLAQPVAEAPPLEWIEVAGGVHEIGSGDRGFAYDNERPRHRELAQDFRIASRCVTNGEWSEFWAAGGYQRAELWLSDGWTWCQRENVRAPLYWHDDGDRWMRFTLGGLRVLDPGAPVCHVSYYEADAFARWAGKRLPRESEWEIAAQTASVPGSFLEDDVLEPCPARAAPGELLQALGDVWEWTASPHAPYPGYQPLAGSLGEYNGKFMCNQMVLRGGSTLTPRAHIRPSYRNFYYPHQRWNTQGLRLADSS